MLQERPTGSDQEICYRGLHSLLEAGGIPTSEAALAGQIRPTNQETWSYQPAIL
jgi:hypothetical protein